ncbi:IMP dehydrogenase [bacterium]|jgi:IMP dehydrogenase|nr:IMP dehydrogenase [bacterium]MBT6832361.1 IMP dehydrogenase [bacterium]MBT6995906.1 IMP dehydrogenase [bacterium]MBT7772767.1 IMP dehydrogenase [bacterium]
MGNIRTALTFDDVLLVPQYSEILPKEVSLETQFTRNVKLNIPLVSAAMDTVTEENMAIAMALHGGIGVIHKNCTPDEQAAMVRRVKRFENGFIREPKVISPEHKISDVIDLRLRYHFKSLPVTEDGTLATKVIGMVTRNDYLQKHADCTVAERMAPLEDLLTTTESISLSAANDILEESKHSKLLVLRKDGTLAALVTRKDIEKNEKFPFSSKDDRKRLLVAAACGPAANRDERVAKLVEAGADVLLVDTAHGHSKGVIETVKFIKKNYPKIDVVGGNIATAAAAESLISAGADAVKVGIGPGSICTTRVISGIGVPQLTAVMDVSAVCKKHKIPLIADGGIRYSGDVAKALAAGANVVMIGSLLAGTEQAPGETIYSGGKTWKYYRGMGSLSAMQKGGKERYAQANVADDKLVPEGIEGKVLFKGDVSTELFQLCGGVRSAMGYSGVGTIFDFQKNAEFVQITGASLKESHPHDISILKEAPNYRG